MYIMHLPLFNYIALLSVFVMYVGTILFQVQGMVVDIPQHLCEITKPQVTYVLPFRLYSRMV